MIMNLVVSDGWSQNASNIHESSTLYSLVDQDERMIKHLRSNSVTPSKIWLSIISPRSHTIWQCYACGSLARFPRWKSFTRSLFKQIACLKLQITGKFVSLKLFHVLGIDPRGLWHKGFLLVIVVSSVALGLLCRNYFCTYLFIPKSESMHVQFVVVWLYNLQAKIVFYEWDWGPLSTH